MRNTKLTDQERIAAVKEYLGGKSSLLSIANKYGIAKSSLRAAVSFYNSQGEDALRSPARNTYYPPDLKRQAVEAYLAGEGSQQDICNRFHIRSRKQLQDWIKLYNGHNDFRSHRGHGSGITMTKGRKTTLDERIEIVSYCVEHGKDYQLTCQKYAVSYNQLYSWVRKYEEKGIEGLADNRGRKKPESEMDENDRLRAENRLLKAENRRLEVELAIIKKLEEIERRRR